MTRDPTRSTRVVVDSSTQYLLSTTVLALSERLTPVKGFNHSMFFFTRLFPQFGIKWLTAGKEGGGKVTTGPLSLEAHAQPTPSTVFALDGDHRAVLCGKEHVAWYAGGTAAFTPL